MLKTGIFVLRLWPPSLPAKPAQILLLRHLKALNAEGGGDLLRPQRDIYQVMESRCADRTGSLQPLCRQAENEDQEIKSGYVIVKLV